jgi:cobalamin synthase
MVLVGLQGRGFNSSSTNTVIIIVIKMKIFKYIQIWIVLLYSYNFFHHYGGTWMTFMEPPKGLIGIWWQLA